MVKIERPTFFLRLLLLFAVLIAGTIFFLSMRKEMAPSLVQAGDWFFSEGFSYNVVIADRLYYVAILVDPNVVDAWHQRARIAFLRGDFAVALIAINQQIALHGDSFMASYYIRGLINGYRKEYEAAEADFERFVAWDPTNWAANNDLAWIYFAEGKFVEAKHQAEFGLVHNTANPWLLTTHAMAVYNLGNPMVAAVELAQAREAVANLTVYQWMRAYPGNDPALAQEGLAAFRATIDSDLSLVHSTIQKR